MPESTAPAPADAFDELGQPQPFCVHCGYILAGATESSKCPECGKPIVEVLRWPEGSAGSPVRRKTSKTMIFGMPLWQIANGPGADGKPGRARAFIAMGDDAMGVVAFGGVARGVIALGGFSFGVFSFGGLTGGLLLANGGIAASGGFALGGVAVGGAVGLGGVGWGYGASVSAVFRGSQAGLNPGDVLLATAVTSVGLLLITALAIGLCALWALARRHRESPPAAVGNRFPHS
ncbi:MAG: hypothetical protein AAFR38_09280 [Planctomycetota bacterium]